MSMEIRIDRSTFDKRTLGGCVWDEPAANSQRFLSSFFFRSSRNRERRRGDERSFVDPSPPRLSLAHIALGSDTTGIRIRVSSPEIPGVSGRIGSRRRRPFRETGVIGVQTGNITPTNPFTDFFLSWMEFKRFRSTCYSPRFLYFRSSLSILFRDQINVRTKQLN